MKNYNKGNAIIIVTIVVAILVLLGLAALRLVNGQSLLAKRTVEFNNTFYAGEKVINDYLWKCNNKTSMVSELSNITKYNVISDNSTQKVFAPVTMPDNCRVRIIVPYESGTLSQRFITVKVTSWPPDRNQEMRTIEAEIVKRDFSANAITTNSEKNSNDKKVYWGPNEKVYGSIHTNDSFYIASSLSGKLPTFYGPVSYAGTPGIDPESYKNNASMFRKGHAQVSPLNLPSNNSDLITYARVGGHYYKGRACIMLNNTSYTIRYWDDRPLSQQGQCWRYNGYPYDFETRLPRLINDPAENCNWYALKWNSSDNAWEHDGSITNQSFEQFKTWLQNNKTTSGYQASLPLPANGVIYVDGSSSVYSNYREKFERSEGNVFVSGQLQGRLTIGAQHDIYVTAYDPTDWRRPIDALTNLMGFSGFDYTGGLTYNPTTTTYSLQPGPDNWDQTVVSGSSQTDMLGLLANHNVRILHSCWPAQIPSSVLELTAGNFGWGLGDGTLSDNSPADITIHGAIGCLNGDFGYERYGSLSMFKGDMTIFGSVTQNTSSNLGTSSTIAALDEGYDRRYIYDPRMRTMTPPSWISASHSGWQLANWRETKNHITP